MMGREVAELLSARLSLSFFPALAGGTTGTPARRAKSCVRSSTRAAAHPVARSALSGSLVIVRSAIIEKYIPQAWERKKYIYVEVSRVQRLALSTRRPHRPRAVHRARAGRRRISLSRRARPSGRTRGTPPSRSSTCRRSFRGSRRRCLPSRGRCSTWAFAAASAFPGKAASRRPRGWGRSWQCAAARWRPSRRRRSGRRFPGQELVQRAETERALARTGRQDAGRAVHHRRGEPLVGARRMRRLGEVLETVVVVAIILVLAHTFLDDVAIMAGWNVRARSWLIWAGLGFDLFFTIEFFTRLYLALSRAAGRRVLLPGARMGGLPRLDSAPPPELASARAGAAGRGGTALGTGKLPERAEGDQGHPHRPDPAAPAGREALPGHPATRAPPWRRRTFRRSRPSRYPSSCSGCWRHPSWNPRVSSPGSKAPS